MFHSHFVFTFIYDNSKVVLENCFGNLRIFSKKKIQGNSLQLELTQENIIIGNDNVNNI